ncbi:MAG: dTDP-4-dehydrorhamnose reductase [Synechococcales bacterium]|nr:dTDP-4-dehydrorhamnose reductase [Cyanobacteria bacterium REEB444]MEB3125577.1 dTDP-4-dehydrorhamnose reductase [Synechococcales bacterium]
MKIVVVGSRGQVGHDLLRVLPPLGDIISLSRSELDLTQLAQITPVIQGYCPTVVINAAAYTAVDRAQTEHELANQINHLAAAKLASAAYGCGAAFIHLSTDYVFNGYKNTPYEETDPTNPLSIYGQTKLQGEVAVQQAHPQSVVVRTAWVYGTAPQSNNFIKTMLRLGTEQDLIKVVVDQIGSPTWSYDIATVIYDLIPLMLAGTTGIYHCTSTGVASWFDVAMTIFDEAQSMGLLHHPPQILPIPTASYPRPAPRPAYSVLSTTKLSQLLQRPLPYWRHSVRKMVNQLLVTL